MSQSALSPEMLRFLQMEDGQCISAGARTIHLQSKGVYSIDLSSIPKSQHEPLLAKIQQLVEDTRGQSIATSSS